MEQPPKTNSPEEKRERAGSKPVDWAYETPASETLSEKLDGLNTRAAEFDTLRQTKPEIWQLVKERQSIFWTASSNQIEGSTLTFSDTSQFLATGITLEGKPFSDYLMAIGHTEAIQYLQEIVETGTPISDHLMKELNVLVRRDAAMTSPNSDQTKRPGNYKTKPNFVRQSDGSVHQFLDPVFVQEEMDRLIGWCEADTDLDPIVKAALAHFNFVRIHPFEDGNGRGARLLMNLILIKSGLPPAIIRFSDRPKYIEALEQATAGNVTAFTEFIAEAYGLTLEDMIKTFNTGDPNGVTE